MIRWLALILSASILPWQSATASDGVAVTLLNGNAEVRATPKSVWRKLVMGDHSIGEESEVRIMSPKGARLELTFPDTSVLRFYAPSSVRLNQFTPKKDYSVRVRLLAGRVWSSVRHAISQRHSHQLFVGTAVMGVRGTHFDTKLSEDHSIDVRLFDGRVALAIDHPSAATVQSKHAFTPPREISAPKEVAGPKEISLHQWLLVLKSMQRIEIGADGLLGAPEKMDLQQQRKDGWIAWNLDRDETTTRRIKQ